MKLVDVAGRNAKELETLKRKVAAFVKHAGCSVGEITWSAGKDGTWHVQVDNDGDLGTDLYDIIKKSPNTQHVEFEEHEGTYMWSADHYVRPASTVSFTF
jgi:hypothetical protein